MNETFSIQTAGDPHQKILKGSVLFSRKLHSVMLFSSADVQSSETVSMTNRTDSVSSQGAGVKDVTGKEFVSILLAAAFNCSPGPSFSPTSHSEAIFFPSILFMNMPLLFIDSALTECGTIYWDDRENRDSLLDLNDGHISKIAQHTLVAVRIPMHSPFW